MSGDPSLIGFGYQPFGSEKFGSSDWAEEVTWKVIPEFYRELDRTTQRGFVSKPLRGLIDAIKPLFEELRYKFQIFPTLWDAQRCPFPQLPALAYNVGVDITSIQTIQLVDVVGPPFSFGEQITGQSTNTIGYISAVSGTTFSVTGIVGIGFRLGETFIGKTSGQSATIASVSGAIPDQTLTIQTFVIGETIKGSQTETKAIVGSASTNTISVDTVTGLGFVNGEAVTGATSGCSGTVNGIGSDGKSERFLRSQVLNASQLWLNKGTTKGYGIVAAFEGLFVIVTPLWSDSCESDPDGELLTTEPPDADSYLGFYDLEIADELSLDQFFADPFTAWPHEVESVVKLPGLPDGRCRSYSLRLFFFTPDDTEIEDFDSISGRILTNLERFRPIHVRFDSITFDGPRVSSQVWWSGPIPAESYAASSWVTNVAGTLQASSQVWSIANFTATNP